MQGRENFRIYPFRLAASRQATLPLLSLRDIFPRPGEVFPLRGSFSLFSDKESKTSPFRGRWPRAAMTERVRPPQAASPSQSSPIGLASSPKGRAKSTAGSFLIALKTSATNLRPWLPFGGAGAGAPERASPVKCANAVFLYDPSRENAFGALRRARQTRNLKYSFR